MKPIFKIFKWMMLALIVFSVVLVVMGFAKGWETPDKQATQWTEYLLYWAYLMVGLTLVASLVVGLVVGIKNNPKMLIKLGIGLVAIAALCFIAYVLAKGAPAVGLTTDQPSKGELKLTDTILNLTYIVGAASILAIIAGEIRLAIINKKK